MQAKCKYLEGTCEGLKRELKLVQDDIDRRLTVREAAEELLYAKVRRRVMSIGCCVLCLSPLPFTDKTEQHSTEHSAYMSPLRFRVLNDRLHTSQEHDCHEDMAVAWCDHSEIAGGKRGVVLAVSSLQQCSMRATGKPRKLRMRLGWLKRTGSASRLIFPRWPAAAPPPITTPPTLDYFVGGALHLPLTLIAIPQEDNIAIWYLG